MDTRFARTLLISLGILVAAPVVNSGCVTKKAYDSLQGELDSSRAAHATEQQRSQTLSQALEEEQARGTELTAQIAELTRELAEARAREEELGRTIEEQLAAAGEERSRLEEQLAGTIKDRSRLKASIEEMQRALALANAQRRLADARIAAYRGLLSKFKSMIDAGKLQVRIINGRMVIILRSDVLFASGSTKISEEGTAAIVELTAILTEMSDRAFQVEGHTDNKPIKTARFPSNWELAAGRAIAVATLMIEGGLPAHNVSAASFGENSPTASNDSEDGRAQNRRIEIVLLPDLSELPGAGELESLGKS